MKKLILISALCLFSLASCEDLGESLRCDCDYVTYDKDPTTNYQWKETYRSSWDITCGDEFLNESQYTDSDGDIWYSETYIECK